MIIHDMPFPTQHAGRDGFEHLSVLKEHRAKLMYAINGQGLDPVAIEQDTAPQADTVIDSLAKVRDAAA